MKREILLEIVPLAEVPMFDARVEAVVPLVLVVDDEPLVADTVAAVLATSGLAVAKAYCGREALDMAMRRVPDLLLSDVMMPGMNGVELAITVAKEMPNCKVMLFSGHASMLDLAPAQAVGLNFPLMTKPVHPVELLRQVFECLGWRPKGFVAEPARKTEFEMAMRHGPQLVA